MTTKPSAPTAHSTTSPQAFRRAQWTMLLATMFCYLFYYTGRQTFGFAIPGIQQEFDLDKAALGWVSAVMLWSYAVGQMINGNLGDKFGGRKMMSLGALLSVILNWIVSFAGGLTSLRIPWMLNGLAQSMGWAPGSRVLSNWWGHHERGVAFGFYVFAAGLSSVIAFATSYLVLEVFHLDWRWIFRLPVLLLLVGGSTYYVIVRNRPQDLGFQPPDSPATTNSTNQPQKTEAEEAPVEIHESSVARYRAVITNWRFMVASLAIGFQNMARYGLLVWVPVHFLGKDYKESGGGAWISIALPIGMALGALSSGWISDRFCASKRSTVISSFMTLAAIMSMTMYFLPKSPLLGIGVLFLCGFFAYGPQSAFWALSPDLLGPRRAGTGVGVMNTFAYALAGLGEPFIGHMIDSYQIAVTQTNELGQSVQVMVDNTGLVFPIVAGACFIGAVISLFIRR